MSTIEEKYFIETAIEFLEAAAPRLVDTDQWLGAEIEKFLKEYEEHKVRELNRKYYE